MLCVFNPIPLDCDCDDIMVSDKLKRLSASPVNPQWSGAMSHNMRAVSCYSQYRLLIMGC